MDHATVEIGSTVVQLEGKQGQWFLGDRIIMQRVNSNSWMLSYCAKENDRNTIGLWSSTKHPTRRGCLTQIEKLNLVDKCYSRNIPKISD